MDRRNFFKKSVLGVGLAALMGAAAKGEKIEKLIKGGVSKGSLKSLEQMQSDKAALDLCPPRYLEPRTSVADVPQLAPRASVASIAAPCQPSAYKPYRRRNKPLSDKEIIHAKYGKYLTLEYLRSCDCKIVKMGIYMVKSYKPKGTSLSWLTINNEQRNNAGSSVKRYAVTTICQGHLGGGYDIIHWDGRRILVPATPENSTNITTT